MATACTPDRPSLVVALTGPTATGKTRLAVEIAAQFQVEVISVDSGQVYQGMDIGTAKPPRAVLAKVPHKLIDICTPWERYSAGRFCRDALAAIADSIAAGKIPLLVGGSSFYFGALEYGLSQLPEQAHDCDHDWLAQADAFGWPFLHAKLMQFDAQSASQISPNDSQRILRLLRMYSETGVPPSELQRDSPPQEFPHPIVKIALVHSSRTEHRQSIGTRYHQMLSAGLLNEARRLYDSPQFDPSLPSMRCVGYKQAWQYFAGDVDYDEMVRMAIAETCSIAKRQLTWIRNQSAMIWLDAADSSPITKVAPLISSLVGGVSVGT